MVEKKNQISVLEISAKALDAWCVRVRHMLKVAYSEPILPSSLVIEAHFCSVWQCTSYTDTCYTNSLARKCSSGQWKVSESLLGKVSRKTFSLKKRQTSGTCFSPFSFLLLPVWNLVYYSNPLKCNTILEAWRRKMRAKDGRVERLKDPRTLVASWYSCISAKLPFLVEKKWIQFANASVLGFLLYVEKANLTNTLDMPRKRGADPTTWADLAPKHLLPFSISP